MYIHKFILSSHIESYIRTYSKLYVIFIHTCTLNFFKTPAFISVHSNIEKRYI